MQARCASTREWDANRENAGALAYTLLRDPQHPNRIVNYTVLSAAVCTGALAIAGIGQASLQGQATAALVLTHEAYHLRVWPLRGNEAAVECRAIRHFRYAVRFLGGSAQLAETLLPYALVAHLVSAV